MSTNLKRLFKLFYQTLKKFKRSFTILNIKVFLLKLKFVFYKAINKKLIHKKNYHKILLDPLDNRSCYVILNRQDPKIKLFKILTKKYDYFIDVGSNYGEFSITLNRNYKKIFAIEPNKKVNTKFKETLNINKIENVKLIEKALIDKKKTEHTFLTNKLSSGGSRIMYRKFNRKDLRNYNKSVVKCISCKQLLNTYIKKKSSLAIKIDVEGYDMKLLLNFLTHLRKNKKKFLIMAEIGGDYRNKERLIKYKKDILKILSNNFYAYEYRNEDCRKKILRVFQIFKKNINMNPRCEVLVTNKKIKNHKINVF